MNAEIPPYLDQDSCFACGDPLSSATEELHHFPVPRRLGGKEVVPLCRACHDLVDRIDLKNWPIELGVKAIISVSREGKLLLMKIASRYGANYA